MLKRSDRAGAVKPPEGIELIENPDRRQPNNSPAALPYGLPIAALPCRTDGVPANQSATMRPRVDLTLQRAHSLSPDDLRENLARPLIPFAELVGAQEARSLDRDWGALQPARIKNGKRQIHPWEEALHPERISVPLGNPKGVGLKSMLDLEGIVQGTPVLWSVGMVAPLMLGPETLLPGLDPETGNERRLGHPTLVAGEKPMHSGDWRGKQARISGELRWDGERQTFVITNKSGRYSRHGDRGMKQMLNVARQFEACGLPVEIRIEGEK